MVVLFLLASRYDKISGLCRYTYTGTSVSGLRRKKKRIPDVRSQKSTRAPKNKNNKESSGLHSPARVQECVTNGVNPTLNRST